MTHPALRLAVLIVSCLILQSSLYGDLPPRRPGEPEAVPPPIEVAPVKPPIAEIAESLGAEWLSTPRPIGVYEDLTAATGVPITGGARIGARPPETASSTTSPAERRPESCTCSIGTRGACRAR